MNKSDRKELLELLKEISSNIQALDLEQIKNDLDEIYSIAKLDVGEWGDNRLQEFLMELDTEDLESKLTVLASQLQQIGLIKKEL